MALRTFAGDDTVSPGDNPNANIVMSNLGNEPMVTLFFINYFVVNHDPESDSYGKTAHGVVSQVDQRYYNIPPIGESLTVRQRVAEDLQNRLKIYDPVHGESPGFTTEGSIAQAVRSAFERGDLQVGKKTKNAKTALTYQSILDRSYKQMALEKMTVEELELALEERKNTAEMTNTKKQTKKT